MTRLDRKIQIRNRPNLAVLAVQLDLAALGGHPSLGFRQDQGGLVDPRGRRGIRKVALKVWVWPRQVLSVSSSRILAHYGKTVLEFVSVSKNIESACVANIAV